MPKELAQSRQAQLGQRRAIAGDNTFSDSDAGVIGRSARGHIGNPESVPTPSESPPAEAGGFYCTVSTGSRLNLFTDREIVVIG